MSAEEAQALRWLLCGYSWIKLSFIYLLLLIYYQSSASQGADFVRFFFFSNKNYLVHLGLYKYMH